VLDSDVLISKLYKLYIVPLPPRFTADGMMLNTNFTMERRQRCEYMATALRKHRAPNGGRRAAGALCVGDRP